MVNNRKLLLIALSVLVASCDASNSSEGASSGMPELAVQVPSVPPESSEAFGADSRTSANALGARLSAGMAYADLRSAVLDAGWLPIQDYACPEKTGGEARICRELPELEACSSDGRCTMWFGHGASRATLRVDTFGDYTRWKVAGDAAVLNVRSWDFSEAASPEAGATASACPAQDFNAFLQAFSADDSVQQRYTQPLVKVMQYRDVGEDFETYPAYVRAKDYDGFRFELDDGGFHVVRADGTVDPAPTALQTTEAADGHYIVSYKYGMSEGNSYRFVREQGCWYLAEDPEPPAP